MLLDKIPSDPYCYPETVQNEAHAHEKTGHDECNSQSDQDPCSDEGYYLADFVHFRKAPMGYAGSEIGFSSVPPPSQDRLA